MTPEKWQKIKTLLGEALELAPAERSAFLEEACDGDNSLRAEIDSLIAHEQEELEPPLILNALDSATFESASASDHPADSSSNFASMRSKRIGHYEIIAELGYGGMGAVYLGERADDEYRQQVAIKLIRKGLDTEFVLRRFRNERQILASLDHPNIARLFDGGTTDEGLPYLVMEKVEGLPINSYCDRHALNTEQRLKLFLEVCAAVEYAHKRQVIHRDLKPSNILVTEEGTLKLLDFGIAKVLTPELADMTIDPTLPSLRLMTPAYASPEQIRGQPVTASSDVYSLAVLLYELLTGHKPYRVKSRDTDEIARAVLEEEPTRPSTAIELTERVQAASEAIIITPASVSKARETTPDGLRRRLRGDLDNILLMALRKEPERRYQSVTEFAEDLRRHVENRPILARRDTILYRTNKFVRRHKLAITPVAFSVLLALSVILFVYFRPLKPSNAPKIQSIAVLPFQTGAGDDHLGTGIAESIISSFSHSPGLTVRPIRASLRYPSMRESAVDAGRALQVDAILQGRVSRSGEQTRITAELISAKDGARLWQSSYTFDRLLDAQDVLPLHVADALDLPKTEIQRTAKRHTNSPEAYEFYLQGRHLFERRRPKELQQAIDYFEKAIKADNSYALAYAGLAHAYILWVSQSAAIERLQKAKAAAQRALTIDDTLDEAHMALGRALVFCDWDWSGSERSFKRAIELNPNSPETHFWYSHNLTAAGRHDEALEELKLAYDIDPFYTAIVLRKGVALYLARRYDRATEEFLRTPFEVDAAYYQVYWRLGLAYAQREMYPDAVSMLEKTQTLSQEKSLGRASLAFVYAKSGKASEARRILQEVTSSESTELPWMMLAGAYGYLGEKDKAIECLERLYQSRDAPIMHLKVEPMLDSIRSDPRYDNLLRRVGLASL